jgi:insulysin
MEKAPLHGALDRCSHFFIQPLFLTDTLDRELRAVVSENKRNLKATRAPGTTESQYFR